MEPEPNQLAIKTARLVQLGAEIDLGIEQIERGEFTEVSAQDLPKFVEAIKAEGRQRQARAAHEIL